jgi:RNA polymerase sigma-70 factor (ECF subfamily)
VSDLSAEGEVAADASTGTPALVDHLFRRHYARMVAGLTRVFGPAHLDLVEDVVQDALCKALNLWPYEGVPENPGAWLVHVARRGALDALRRNAMARRKEDDLARWAATQALQRDDASSREPHEPLEIRDDRLRMIFTCCHPALAPEARVALTLKTSCGFGVGEIARAFLTTDTAIAQRLVRAKRRIQEDAIPFDVPGMTELPARLDAVLEVAYLVFNEGYTAGRGADLVRTDLVHEAVRLCELLLESEATRLPRVHALLALMLLQGARLPARTDDVGEMLTLARQDRSLWDAGWMRAGFHHFERSIAGHELSAYHVQAAIACCHASARTYADTDWGAILAHYDDLQRIAPSPIVSLNRAVAVAKVHGIEAALAELDRLSRDASLKQYFLLPATRGRFLWARGDREAAAQELARAIELGGSDPEREFLRRSLERCRAGAEPDAL